MTKKVKGNNVHSVCMVGVGVGKGEGIQIYHKVISYRTTHD